MNMKAVVVITWASCFALMAAHGSGVAAPERLAAGEAAVADTTHGFGTGCPDDCIPTADLPAAFSLGPAEPNPARGSAQVAYAVPGPGTDIRIRVYDVRGRLTATLINGTSAAGRYFADWHGRDAGGGVVAPGVYFIRMDAGTFHAVSKVMVIR